MSSRSIRSLYQSEIENKVVLLNTLNVNRFQLFIFIFVCFVISELSIANFALSAVWVVLLRLSLFLLFALLWLNFCSYGFASILASAEGLYFLISRKFNRCSDKYFFITWEDVACIEYSKDMYLRVKTQIPLSRKKGLRSIPDEFQSINLESAHFCFPELFDKTVLIEVPMFNIKKWLDLGSAFPVCVVK